MNDLERQQRLADFFQSNPSIWKDIEDEARVCLDNATDKLMSYPGVSNNRDFYAGYCNGIKDIIKFKRQYITWEQPK